MAGDVVISITSPDYDIDEKEPVLIEFEGYRVPFFIVEDSIRNCGKNQISLRFDTIKSAARAAQIVGKNIWVLKEDLITYQDDDDDFQDDDISLAGYTFYNADNELIGVVTDFVFIPGNPLIIVEMSNKKELQIPVNAVNVISRDDQNKTMTIEIPEGLIEAIL